MAYTVIMAAPTLAEPAHALLTAAGMVVHALPAPTPAALAELCRAVQADAILAGQTRIGPEVLLASPRLRIVARHGAGVDSVDLVAAAAAGITVTRAPDANARAVAELTLAFILALAKDLRPQAALMAAGGWRIDARATRDMAGLRLGLVGYGTIARLVESLAAPFGMDVAHHRRNAAESGGLTLHALLARSDVLSLHVPITPATRTIIGAAELAALPPGAMVINTSRGGLIDEPALLAALDSGHVAGAALDVFAQEPPPLTDPLRRHPRVVCTPHMAGSTVGALGAVGIMAAECIVAGLTGGTIPPDRIVRP